MLLFFYVSLTEIDTNIYTRRWFWNSFFFFPIKTLIAIYSNAIYLNISKSHKKWFTYTRVQTIYEKFIMFLPAPYTTDDHDESYFAHTAIRPNNICINWLTMYIRYIPPLSVIAKMFFSFFFLFFIINRYFLFSKLSHSSSTLIFFSCLYI